MIAGHGPLLPDRQVLPRRGPARRSAAGVHAGRPRDLVRDRGSRVRDHRAVMERLMALIGRDGAAAVPAHAVRRGDREVRVRQAGPALRDGDRRSVGGVRRRLRSRCSATRSRRAAKCAGSSCRARRSTRDASSTSSSSRRSSSAPPVWSGRARAEGAVQSSALKAAGEEAIRQALELAGAGPADLAA